MKKRLYASLAVIAILCMAATAATVETTRSPRRSVEQSLDIFNSLVKELQGFYVDTIDMEKVMNYGIEAMLSELDPYTEYIPYNEQDDINALSTGEYGGIGSFIQERPNRDVAISLPQEGSPAKAAGLRPGDIILRIDTTDVTGWGSEKVSSRLKGLPGSKLSVTVRRPYATPDSILTFELTRQTINIASVPYFGMLDNGVGYITLNQFSGKTPAEFSHALDSLQRSGNLISLVIDLRGNGGGVVESAVQLLSNFVPKGTEVLRTKGKGVLSEKIYKTTSKPTEPKLPLVVLIDGSTASASEIVAGALQDLDRAVIVGNRSYGKGLVQTARPLPYDGMLKVTLAKYYIPSGRLIQAIDYSHRNADGSVNRIPDSLTTVFRTASGREVRDGGGITPDTTVTYPLANRLIYNLVRGNWIFDYAVRFAATTPTVAPPGEFTITDSIYNDFKAFVNPEKFDNDKAMEQMVDQVEELVRNEGYMTDSVATEIKILRNLLKRNLNNDLDNNRRAVSNMLSAQIMANYYGRPGELRDQLRDDPGLETALYILSDPKLYRQILSPAKK